MGIYEDTISHFSRLIEEDATLKPLLEDVGMQKIIEVVAYSQELRLNQELVSLAESVYPQSMKMLLLKLMRETAYLRLKKPLVVEFSIESKTDIILPRNAKFTSGNKLLYLNSSANLNVNEKSKVRATVGFFRKKRVTIDSTGLVTRFKLGCTYLELTGVEGISTMLRFDKNFNIANSNMLRFSQNFNIANSNAMFNIDMDGEMELILKNSQFQKGAIIDIYIFTSPTEAGEINRLAYINGSMIIEDINIIQKATEPMTPKEILEILTYDRGILGDIITNNDYKTFLQNALSNLKLIKVWFEKEESRQNGFSLSNTNKVFISYLNSTVTDDGLNSRIEDLIISKVQDRAVIFVPPTIVTPTITIDVYGAFSEQETASIKNLLMGKYSTISRKSIRGKIKSRFGDIEMDISLDLSGASGKLNEFYLIERDSVVVNVVNHD